MLSVKRTATSPLSLLPYQANQACLPYRQSLPCGVLQANQAVTYLSSRQFQNVRPVPYCVVREAKPNRVLLSAQRLPRTLVGGGVLKGLCEASSAIPMKISFRLRICSV